MPKHREGPVRHKQTGYYFFDEYVGIGGDSRANLQTSLRNTALLHPSPEVSPVRALWGSGVVGFIKIGILIPGF